MKKAKLFKADKEKRATIGGITNWLRDNKNMQVYRILHGQRLEITKDGKTFG